MCLKIGRSVKTPWYRPCMGVVLSALWAPLKSLLKLFPTQEGVDLDKRVSDSWLLKQLNRCYC